MPFTKQPKNNTIRTLFFGTLLFVFFLTTFLFPHQAQNSIVASAASYQQICDTNKDKKLSKAEKKACITKCDTNKNGKVSQQEKRVCRGVKSRTPKPTKSTTPVVVKPIVKDTPVIKPEPEVCSPLQPVISQPQIAKLIATPKISDYSSLNYFTKVCSSAEYINGQPTVVLRTLSPESIAICKTTMEFEYIFNPAVWESRHSYQRGSLEEFALRLKALLSNYRLH
jgi:hypothetical protein